MLSYAAFRVMRIESIFVTAAALLLGPALRNRWPARQTVLTSLVNQKRAYVAAAIFGALVVIGLRTDFRSLTCIGVWSATRPDQHAMSSLKHAEDGRIVTFFDWGQYALWHLGPRLRVSMDGRRETVYTDGRLAEHDAVLAGTRAGLDRLADWRAEYVWLPATSKKTAQWLVDNGYRLDVVTSRSFVAVRADLPILPPPVPLGDPRVNSCFPG
jgi:hypothetical protein